MGYGVVLVTGIIARHELRQAEVQDLDHTLVAQHHVRRLQVAMDDASGVGPGQRVRHGDRGPQDLPEPHPLSRDERVEGLPGDVLHDDEVDAVG